MARGTNLFCTNLRSQSAIGIDDQIDVITQQRYSEFGGTAIGHNCKIELLYRLEYKCCEVIGRASA
jgi:hypothetical protein